MNWEKAEMAAIDDSAYYLVQDNGAEWRDFDLSVQKGYLVRGRLEPRFVRGRPEWIAKIIRPAGCRDEPQVTQNQDGTTTWTDNAGSETR